MLIQASGRSLNQNVNFDPEITPSILVLMNFIICSNFGKISMKMMHV